MKYTVEEFTQEINEDEGKNYWENGPHGCDDDDCEGHFEDEDRLFAITNLFDRHAGDGTGYFSEARAKLLAHFMEAQP